MTIQLRQWQKEKLQEALNALITKKTLLLNVTTGAGKTLFVLLLGKLLQKKILFLTRTHSEFEAVARDANILGLKIAYLFGKNSVCPFATEDVKPEEIDCKSCKLMNSLKEITNLSPSQILQMSKSATDYCPYYSLRRLSVPEADVITASYLYFFNPVLRRNIICDTKDCLKSDELLVIVDEAHNLISADEWFTIKINKRSVTNALKELDVVEDVVEAKNKKKHFDNAKEFLTELESFFKKIKTTESCKELIQYPKPQDKALRELYDAFIEYLDMLTGPIKKSSLRSVYNFFNAEGDVFNCAGSLTLIPSNAHELVKRAFRSSDMRILMSGTLPDLGIEGYLINVDVKLGKAEYYYCDWIDSKAKNRKTNAPKYAEIIKYIFNNSQSNVLAYFPSYDFKNEVIQYLTDIPVLEENAHNQKRKRKLTHNEILRLMEEGRYVVALVMNAKESEGVEFRGKDNRNLFTEMILAGLPYPDITDDLVVRRIRKLAVETKKPRESIEHELTLITIRQTIGRALRSENDFVRIYLCDYRYKHYIDITNANRFSPKELKVM